MPFKFNALTGNFDFVSSDTLGDLSPTKGNIAVGNGTSWTVLAVGSDGQTLTADSAEATGIAWDTPAGGGDVVKVGTPVDGQVGVWTGDGTIEGDAALTFDTTTDSLVIGASGNLKFGAVTVLADSAGTTTLSNIDALDATTDATITSALSDSYQPLDSTLTAFAAYNTNGILTQTATDTFTGRTITGTTNEITVTNGDGVSGNPTLSLPATIDLGGKTSLEIPNSATPTVDADGEIAVDTSVTDFSHGVLKYYGGEEMGVVAMPIAQFTSPTDDYVVTYNATNDEFELQPGGSGGGFQAELNFPMSALRVNTTLNFPPNLYIDLGTVEDYFRAFDDTTQEYVIGSFACPSDLDTSGTVTFEIYGKRATGTAASNIYWDFDHRAIANNESADGSYTTVSSGALAVSTTTANLDRLTFTETVSTLGWAANDFIAFRISRDSADAGDTLSGDYYGWNFRILIPRA